MKCCDCEFISGPGIIGTGKFPSVRCTLGLWDKDNKEGVHQYYSYGSLVRNRGPVRRHGESCTQGKEKT